MKNFLLIIMISLGINGFSQIPYNPLPDWESTPANRVSTGLGLADINGDGFKDMIVADGNDILRQHLTIHYNNGDGTFNLEPDWESADIDYHGHLAVADFNQDGWYDVAVSVYIGEAGFSEPGRLKVYYNQGGELESSPSFESMPFYTFSCAAGDANGDGWPDIAVACGEPYGEITDYGRIYYSDNGTFSDDNIWQSDIEMASIDVEFGDIIQDGYLDVIFIGAGEPNYVYASDNMGAIQSNPAWQSTDAENNVNSVDIVYNDKIVPESHYVVMTGNDQLGGDGKVKLYVFYYEPYATEPEWESNYFGYGSGALFDDVNNNDTINLIYGGWWLPVNIALYQGFGFEMNPSFTSSTGSVVEAIATADLSKNSVHNKIWHYTFNYHSNIFYIKDYDVESVDSVQHENNVLPDSAWTYIPGKNWILLKERYSAGQHLFAYYKASDHRDMVVTNWDQGKGNYIFYNQNTPVASEGHSEIAKTDIYPNPARNSLSVRSKKPLSQVSVYDITGRAIKVIDAYPKSNIEIDLHNLPDGCYFLTGIAEEEIFYKKFVVRH